MRSPHTITVTSDLQEDREDVVDRRDARAAEVAPIPTCGAASPTVLLCLLLLLLLRQMMTPQRSRRYHGGSDALTEEAVSANHPLLIGASIHQQPVL
jgi:hypothetical protein